jgi:starch phosphorylase
MNEGHSAFLALERTCQLMDLRGLSFAEARELSSAGLVFTTHTPVPAGHDRFPPHLMERYFADYYQHRLGLSLHEFLALGRENPADEGEWFSMTTLALRMSAYSNGVSSLHGQVTREMARGLWPNVPVDEIPIGHVTNGVHFQTWISLETEQLYDRYLGSRWRQEPADERLWQQFERVPAEELWRTHERRRERMLVFVRRRLREQLTRRGAPRQEVEAADDVLDLRALTIGFARRFATYKRATLLMRDPERLLRLLTNPERPVQIIFAGKAHPHDNGGKELIQQIVGLSRQSAFRRRIVFLEDYGMTTARYLVQGADLWLNTPLRPLEASGTSGMKALANAVLNMSTLDGWWDEAWQETDRRGAQVGWAIGRGETYENSEYQNQVEAEALYNLLERDVVPAFYDRGPDELPRRWIALMKASLGQLAAYFNTHRMVREYAERFYLPAVERFDRLAAGEADVACSLAAWRKRVELAWPRVWVERVDAERSEAADAGSTLVVRAQANLDCLKPEEVAVQLYLGRVNGAGEIVDAQCYPLKPTKPEGERGYLFESAPVPTSRSGLHGYTVRVLPDHPDLASRIIPGLITWASPEAAADLAADK